MEKKKDDNIQINISKKNLIITIVSVVLVGGLLFLASYASNSYGSGKNAYKFTDITIDEYLELMKNEEKQIVYLSKIGCPWCEKENPIIKKLGTDYNLKIYHLDATNFFDNATNQYTEDGMKLINSHELYSEGYGTPNTLIVQNGDIVDYIDHYAEEKDLLELFKNNGFINE